MQPVGFRVIIFAALLLLATGIATPAQSGRVGNYSEGISKVRSRAVDPKNDPPDTIRVETDLVIVPVRVTSRDLQPITNLKQSEFRIFEDGEQQSIAYFSTSEQPFTVAMLLDVSYSTVFKIEQIQAAAMLFISKLRESDKVAIIAFDQKPRVLCRATNDRRALKIAIESIATGSGTSLYDAMDLAMNNALADVPGRKAMVLLSDGVDTRSGKSSARDVLRTIAEEDVLTYPIRYDTFDDVRKSRRNNAEIQYDDDDRPYIVERPPEKGEREEDYVKAREFLDAAAESSGGHVFKVSSSFDLNSAFERIADELRKTYSLGYYPTQERRPGAVYTLKVRIYRPDLSIRVR